MRLPLFLVVGYLAAAVFPTPSSAEGASSRGRTREVVCPPDAFRAAVRDSLSNASDIRREEFSRTGGPVVSGVRFGAYPDKTRIVLDVSDELDFSYSIDPSGTMVIINLPQADWRTARSSRRNRGPIRGYFFDWDSNGIGHLGISTTEAVRIKAAFGLPPNGRNGHRIVLDLEPLEAFETPPVRDDRNDMVSDEKAALISGWRNVPSEDEVDVVGVLTPQDREVKSRLPQGTLPLFDPDKISSIAEEGIDEVAAVTAAPRRALPKTREAVCPAFPQVLWWENNTHEQTISYVNSRYKGDWNAYGAKWERHLAKVIDVFTERKQAYITKAGITLKGADFVDYVQKIEERIAVIKCLSRRRPPELK